MQFSAIGGDPVRLVRCCFRSIRSQVRILSPRLTFRGSAKAGGRDLGRDSRSRPLRSALPVTSGRGSLPSPLEQRFNGSSIGPWFPGMKCRSAADSRVASSRLIHSESHDDPASPLAIGTLMVVRSALRSRSHGLWPGPQAQRQPVPPVAGLSAGGEDRMAAMGVGHC